MNTIATSAIILTLVAIYSTPWFRRNLTSALYCLKNFGRATREGWRIVEIKLRTNGDRWYHVAYYAVHDQHDTVIKVFHRDDDLEFQLLKLPPQDGN